MNVTVNFYYNVSDNRCLFKNISQVFTADFVFYDDSSIITPRLRLAYNGNITNCNYFYIPSLGRYYYIDNIDFNRGGEMIVTGRIDVLMTYQNEISGIECVMSRIEHYNLTTIPDTNIVIKNYDIINIYASSVGFDTGFGNYVLELYGG